MTGYWTCRRCLFQKKASVSEDRTRRPQKTRSSSFYGFFLPFASFSLECSERHHRSIHRSAKFPIRVCPQILANEVFFKFILARCIKRLRSGNTGSREAAGRADKKECRLSLQLCSWRVLIFHGESSRYALVCATVSGHVNTLVRGSLLLFSQCFLSFSGVSFGFGWGWFVRSFF